MELDELGIDIEAQNCLDQIQQESRTSADYDPSQGMTGEELHNFCKFLYSQIQSKDEEISRLTANIKELTDEVRLSRLQQQTYNDENKAVSASHSHKLDVVLQQLQETRQELTDTKRKLKTAETLLADAKEKNRQLEAEREKDAKERKDLENDIALLRSDLYSGTKSQQSGRSAEEVGANDGRDDSMVRMHLYQRQIVRMMCPQRQTLMARNQRNLNPESLITLRKTETLVKELREHQLLRQYIMVLLVRVVLIISIQLVRRLSISAI